MQTPGLPLVSFASALQVQRYLCREYRPPFPPNDISFALRQEALAEEERARYKRVEAAKSRAMEEMRRRFVELQPRQGEDMQDFF